MSKSYNFCKGSSISVYTPEEMEEYKELIAGGFGKLNDRMLHDTGNLDGVHIDILVTTPTKEHPCINLVTMGAANSSPNETGGGNEFVITLPASWPMDLKAWEDERYYWPIRLLQDAARFTVSNGKKIAWLHTLDHGKTYASDTKLRGCIFLTPSRCQCYYIHNRLVDFLQIVPLYRRELDFCRLGGNCLLSDRFAKYYADKPFAVIDPERPSLL